jgi:phage shock protein E
MIYCAAGGRSAKAAALMQSLGFKKVYELKGGYRNW